MRRKLTKPELIVKYLTEHPDEELTVADIATKLDCSISAAYMTMYRALKIAHLEHVNVIRISEYGKRQLAAGAT